MSNQGSSTWTSRNGRTDENPQEGAAPATVRTRSPTAQSEFRMTIPSDGSNSKFHVGVGISRHAALRHASKYQYGPSRQRK